MNWLEIENGGYDIWQALLGSEDALYGLCDPPEKLPTAHTTARRYIYLLCGSKIRKGSFLWMCTKLAMLRKLPRISAEYHTSMVDLNRSRHGGC